MHQLDIPDIRARELLTVMALAEYGSFVAAAAYLKTSQPALTRTIKRVERVLGVTLFARNTRRVEITPAGREFVAVAERMLNDLKLTSRNLGEIANEQRGRITISTYSAFASQTMPPLAKCFLATRPFVELHIREGLQSDIVEDVRSGVADFGIGLIDTADEPFKTEFLFRRAAVCRASAGTHAVQAEAPVGRLAELKGEALVSVPNDTDLPPGGRDRRGVAGLQHPLRGDRGPVPHDPRSRVGRRRPRHRPERRPAAAAVEGLRGVSADGPGARADGRDDHAAGPLPVARRDGAGDPGARAVPGLAAARALEEGGRAKARHGT